MVNEEMEEDHCSGSDEAVLPASVGQRQQGGHRGGGGGSLQRF